MTNEERASGYGDRADVPKDKRMETLRWAADQWDSGWVARPALELIGERDAEIARLKPKIGRASCRERV